MEALGGMMNTYRLVRCPAIALTGACTALLLFGLPVHAQTIEIKASQPSLAKGETPSETGATTIVPSSAMTVNDLTIPIDQLELLIKPLAVEQLQVEADAWFVLLQNKVQHISTAEIVIKRENIAIKQEEEARKILSAAEVELLDAENTLIEASPGTPQYKEATQQLEQAKRSLQEAENVVKNATSILQAFQSDAFIQDMLEKAEFEEKRLVIQKIIQDAKQERSQVTNPGLFKTLSSQIEQLETTLFSLETIETNLKNTTPGSEAHQTLSELLSVTSEDVLQISKELLDSGLIVLSAQERITLDIEETETNLGEIFEDIHATDVTLDEITRDTKDISEERLERAIKQLEDVAESQRELKNQLVATVVQLQGEQLAIINRFQVILDALERKGGEAQSYRLYIHELNGIAFDFTDVQGLKIRLLNWLSAEDGGIRWGVQLTKFCGIVLVTVVLAPWLGRGANNVLLRIDRISSLLREFMVMLIRRGTLVAGGLIALSSLGVSLGPLLALLGGASFVLAFALQSNLGNFASGLMLMVNKPFDIGDEIQVAGYWAYVHSISLATTQLKDFSGNIVTLPNNTVWGGDIINYTHSDIRKHMINIYVKFTQDMDVIYKMWIALVAQNPKVLSDPGPGWFPWNGHYEYYICIGLSAWTKTEDYWDVYVELLKAIQVRTQELGIELAAPVQEIKVINNSSSFNATSKHHSAPTTAYPSSHAS